MDHWNIISFETNSNLWKFSLGTKYKYISIWRNAGSNEVKLQNICFYLPQNHYNSSIWWLKPPQKLWFPNIRKVINFHICILSVYKTVYTNIQRFWGRNIYTFVQGCNILIKRNSKCLYKITKDLYRNWML